MGRSSWFAVCLKNIRRAVVHAKRHIHPSQTHEVIRTTPQRASKPHPKEGDPDLQRAVLLVILQRHPAELTFIELADHLFESANDPNAGTPLARAVRDLATGGLVKSRGPLVLPTRAALHVKAIGATSPDLLSHSRGDCDQ
jgi:hypothetical protein